MPSYGTDKRDKDIQLPNTTGKVDPRLKRKPANPLEGLRQAGEGLKTLKEKGLFGKRGK